MPYFWTTVSTILEHLYHVQLHIFAFQSHISADKVLLSTCCIAEIINDGQSK